MNPATYTQTTLSPRSAMAIQQRPAAINVPPAKRIRTESSASDTNIAQSGITSVEETRHQESDRWFDHANNDAVATKSIPFTDNEPPFFIRRQSYDEARNPTDKPAASAQKREKIGPTAPTASLLAKMNASNDDGSEDFRSVIDDLTIQNQKLRRKLGKYERLHCSHLQKEKLFEVKFHGLPAHKKRELEYTLRSFASSIEGESQRGHDIAKALPSTVAGSTMPHKPSSSATSGSRPIDSAYASLSSTCISQPYSRTKTVSQTTQINVKSYLNDIPETLMPSNCFAMSESSRSKLVVRRLEQIFTGKGGKLHRQGQTQQQQEVSTAAAQADRSKIEACGQRVWREGTREALIQPDSVDFHVESMEDSLPMPKSRDEFEVSDSEPRETQTSRAASPEQRPTRPLDLDIHRAQTPSDNIEYIRHLGLASPTQEDNVMVDRDDGWVYLNLLISMAQLHTLNVTPDNIRKAVKGYSKMLELSEDGTKVRWLGGNEGTQLSSDGDESEERSDWKPSDSSSFANKHRSTADISNKDEIESSQEPAQPKSGTRRHLVYMGNSDFSDAFHYRPLFNPSLPSDGTEDSDANSSSAATTNSLDDITGVNASFNAMHDKQRRPRCRKHDVGPMIFYNGAKFYTDLGGDPDPTNEDTTYHRYSHRPLGCSDAPTIEESDVEASADSLVDSMDVDASLSQSPRSALNLDDLKNSISGCASDRNSPVPMEASGLGGIHPEDNFVVRIQTRRALGKKRAGNVSPFSVNKGPMRRVLHSMPKTARNAFKEENDIPRCDHQVVNTKIISAVKTDITPSKLPPPSYVHLPFSSSESDDDSDEADDSDEVMSAPRPAVRQNMQYRDPKPTGLVTGSSLDTEAKEPSSESEDDGSDDSSIDLLAYARIQDPEAVCAREEEFKRNSASHERPLAAAMAGLRPQQDKGSDVDSMSVDRESRHSDWSD